MVPQCPDLIRDSGSGKSFTRFATGVYFNVVSDQPRGCKLDTKFVRNWAGLKVMCLQVNQVSVKKRELDDYTTQFFAWAPELNVVEYILPKAGWRFFRHKSPERISKYESYVAI